MTLIYRGVAYSQPTAIAVSAPTLVTGKYRGAEMRLPHPASAPISQYRFNLKYRGVSYQATTNVAVPHGLATAF